MPSNDKEVWEHFQGDGESEQWGNFLAYASYSFDKFEWMERFQELHNREPDAEETRAWVSQLPNSRLGEMQEWAENFFDEAARAYLADEHAQNLKEATEGALVKLSREGSENSLQLAKTSNESLAKEIKEATSFRATFLPNIFVGVLSSLLFAVLLVIAAVIFARDPSPIALAKKIPGVSSSTANKPAD